MQVVKLSDAVQTLPRQTTQFIHGVPQQFLAVGDKKSAPAPEGEERFSRGAYFMGKAVWAKGYTELLSLLESHRTAGNTEHHIDCYGNGEDLEAVSVHAFVKLIWDGAAAQPLVPAVSSLTAFPPSLCQFWLCGGMVEHH